MEEWEDFGGAERVVTTKTDMVEEPKNGRPFARHCVRKGFHEALLLPQ